MGVLYLICWRRNYPQDRGTRPHAPGFRYFSHAYLKKSSIIFDYFSMKKIRLKNYFVPLTFSKAPVRTVASPELAPVFVPKAGVVPVLYGCARAWPRSFSKAGALSYLLAVSQ